MAAVTQRGDLADELDHARPVEPVATRAENAGSELDDDSLVVAGRCGHAARSIPSPTGVLPDAK